MSAHRMNNADAAWLHMDRPTNLMVVNSILWFDEPFDVERSKEVLRARLVERFPRFRQRVAERRLGIGVPSWEEDPNFDLDRHVHHIALPEPGDKAALEALVSDLMATPLDRTKPLWDTYLVDGYRGGMAMVSRMHHCIADGIALSRLLLSLTDSQPDANIAPLADERGNDVLAALLTPLKAGAHLADAGLREWREILTHPASELPALARSGRAEVRTLAKLLLTPADTRTVFSGDLGRARRATWSERMPLETIKTIGRALDATVNDVLVAAMTGALRRYLVRRGELVEEIRTMVPFNLRPLDQPLPRELGNRFGLVYLSLPVGVEDPMQRVREVHRRMEEIKHSPEGVLSYAILEGIGLTPPRIEQPLLDVFSKKVSAVMTNVPGPREPLYFAGTKLAGVVGWVPAAGSIGMGVSIFSYSGGVIVGFQVDPSLVPDPEMIITDFEQEVSALRHLARIRTTRPPRTATRERRRRQAAASARAPGGSAA